MWWILRNLRRKQVFSITSFLFLGPGHCIRTLQIESTIKFANLCRSCLSQIAFHVLAKACSTSFWFLFISFCKAWNLRWWTFYFAHFFALIVDLIVKPWCFTWAFLSTFFCVSISTLTPNENIGALDACNTRLNNRSLNQHGILNPKKIEEWKSKQ
jgi:hypothetical protein